MSDVRLFAPVDAEAVFPALRKVRQAKAHKRSPLHYLYASSGECVRALLAQPPPDGLDPGHVAPAVLALLGKPPLMAVSGQDHVRIGIFLDTDTGQAFVVSLAAKVALPSQGGPAAFVAASIAAEAVELDDPLGLELTCLFAENALANAELAPGQAVDVWAGRDMPDEVRRRIQVLTRLAGREAVFRSDLPVGRGCIATLPARASRVIVADGADDASTQRWRGTSIPVVDVASDDCLELVRGELALTAMPVLRDAVSRARAAASITPGPPASPPAAAESAPRPPAWDWTAHARQRAEERDVSIALVDMHVIEPARDVPPKQINRDPEAPAEGRTAIVGECPKSPDMPDGCRLYRGVIPGAAGGTVVVLAVGWIPQPGGGRKIHTLYLPGAHPASWNTDYTRGTSAGEAAGDFPRGTRWFLPP